MSRASQLAFLTKLEKELQRSSRSYRRHNANKRVQHMTISLKAIRRGLRERLEVDFADVPSKEQFISEFLKSVEPLLRTFVADIVKKIRAIARESDTVTVKKTGDNFLAIFSPELNAKGGQRDIFRKAYRTYEARIKTLAGDVNEALEKSVKKAKKYRPGQIWNFEHNNLKGVVETMVRDTMLEALEDAGVGTLDQVLRTLKIENPELELEIVRDLDGEQMEIFIGSAVSNSAEAKISNKRKQELQKSLTKALSKLRSNPAFRFETMEGSDSILDAKRKKIVKKTVVDSFSKIKGVKVTSEDIQIRKGAKAVKLSPKVKETLAGTPKAKRTRTRFKVGQSPASAPLALIAQINRELPGVVAKNMTSPKLNYQTGRFAASVRVTDVVTTKQGYPSFGYTYQKYPYQTFEPGFAQGDPDRDPRKLINQSIREIAAKFAIGRFYTRRV